MAEVFANSKDTDQIPHSVASDLGLHCLPNTLLGVSRLKWVKNQRNMHYCCSKIKKKQKTNLSRDQSGA